MSELAEMVLSGEILGCSLCEDIAFNSYNEINELKDAINWYLECDGILEWAARFYADEAYDEYIRIMEEADSKLMEALK